MPKSCRRQREQRIQDAIALKKPDRVPIACMWDFFPAKRKGVSIKEVMYNFQLMFDLWVDCMDHFSPDLADNPYTLRGFGPLMEILDFQHLTWAGLKTCKPCTISPGNMEHD